MKYLKAREGSKGAFRFLTGTGGLNRLRVHAAPLKEGADEGAVLTKLREDNPGWEFRVQEVL